MNATSETPRYALIDSNSGFLWDYTTATDAVAACKLVDEKQGEAGRTYTEYSGGARVTEDHYLVYEMPISHVEVEDGQDWDGIERIKTEGRLVARVTY